jgi:hypothetical protein
MFHLFPAWLGLPLTKEQGAEGTSQKDGAVRKGITRLVVMRLLILSRVILWQEAQL